MTAAPIADARPCDVKAERIVAGWLIQGDADVYAKEWPTVEDLTVNHFFGDGEARTAFSAAKKLRWEGKPVDEIQVRFRSGLEPEQIKALVAEAPDSLGFAAMADRLREMHRRRQALHIAKTLTDAAVDNHIENLEDALQGAVRLAEHIPGTTRISAVPIMEMLAADAARRLAVNLLGEGFLRRGQGGFVNGPTGIGKSVAFTQAAFCWACGRDFFGIRPEHPLVVLLVQSENDDEDLAEMRDGILAGLEFTAEERELIRKNVFTVRSFKSGLEWLREIEPLMVKHRPDILLADPLFAYAGVDVAKDQPGLSAFLREMVQPFIIKHACGIIFAHHTNKPPSGKDKPNWQAGDYAYAGSGHNELANWPRFVVVLRSLGSRTVYELRIGKRWKRAGICDTNGQPTDRALIQHSDTGICWKTATEQDLARTIETAGATARSTGTVDGDEVIVKAFNACAKKGRADVETVAKRCKFSEKTLRRRFKDDRGNARLVRSGDDVLTITNAQVVAVEMEAQDDLAA